MAATNINTGTGYVGAVNVPVAIDTVAGEQMQVIKVDVGGAGASVPFSSLISGGALKVTGGGGGTEYTEGDTDATITGGAMLMEGAANTLLPIQGTVADGLLVNLGGNNDVRITDGTDVADVIAVNGSKGLVVVCPSHISTVNSTSATLGANAVFTGTWEEITNYGILIVSVYASHASATSGFVAQYSSDGTNVDNTDTFTIPAANGKLYSFACAAKYFRIVYTNGGTIQTAFRLQTTFKTAYAKPSSHRVGDSVSLEDDAELSKSVIAGETTAGGGSFVNVKVSPSGALQVAGTLDAITSLTQMNGQAIAMGTGVRSAGTQRVTVATDDLVPVSNTVLSVVGNGAAATAQRVTLANDSTGVLATVTNLAQLGGQAVAMGTGARTAGTQRVTVATDDSIPVTNTVLSVVGNGAAATAQRVTLANDSTGVLGTVTNLSQLGGQAVAMGTGVRSAGTLRVTIATDDSVPVTGTITAVTAITNALPAGTNNIGDVDVLTLPGVAGVAAHNAAISGNPVRTGMRAGTALFTAVADGNTVDTLSTITGKQVVMPYCLPACAWRYVSPAGGIVNTTAISLVSAGGAGVKNYVTTVSLVNSHQTTGTEIVIRNVTTTATVLYRTWCQFAGGGVALKFDPPLASIANEGLEILEVTATGTAGVVATITGYTATE